MTWAQLPRPTSAEDLVNRAGRREHPAPRDPGRDQRDYLRQEQYRPRHGAHPARYEPAHDGGDRQAKQRPGSH